MKFGMKFLLAAGLQVVCLVGMIGYKHSQYWGGQKVLLEVPRPKDPRSLFSGDYVIVNYAIDRIDLNVVAHDREDYGYNATIYVTLTPKGDIYVPTAVSAVEPKSGLFIKGKAQYRNEQWLEATYGIEQYYVPEGTGLKAEDRLRAIQRAWVKIGRNGDAMTVGVP